MGRGGGCDHYDFTNGSGGEYRRKYDEEKKEILAAAQLPFCALRFPARLLDPLSIRDSVKHEENPECHCEPQGPHMPEVIDGPIKRNAIEISQKERRIPYRSQCAPHVAYNEDKENDVKFPDTGLVEAQERTYEQHGSARSPEDV